MSYKKGEGLSLQTIIVFIILIIVLVIIVLVFTGQFGDLANKLREIFTGVTESAENPIGK